MLECRWKNKAFPEFSNNIIEEQGSFHLLSLPSFRCCLAVRARPSWSRMARVLPGILTAASEAQRWQRMLTSPFHMTFVFLRMRKALSEAPQQFTPSGLAIISNQTLKQRFVRRSSYHDCPSPVKPGADSARPLVPGFGAWASNE